MKYAIALAAAASAATLAFAAPVLAADSGYTPEGKGSFLVDLRVTTVVPEANDPIYTAAGAPIGLNVKVGDSVMPTLGFTYFFTDNLSVEAIAGFTHHTAYVFDPTAAGAPGTKVHSTWVLPPVITLQYRPFPKAKISPYVGAGVNAMVYFAGSDYNGHTVSLKDEFGYAFQAGADVALTGKWFINLDAKKVFTNTQANIDSGALHSHIGLSPWVVSAGIGRKF